MLPHPDSLIHCCRCLLKVLTCFSLLPAWHNSSDGSILLWPHRLCTGIGVARSRYQSAERGRIQTGLVKVTVGLLQIIRVLSAACCQLFLCHLLYRVFITGMPGSVLRTSGNQLSGVYNRKSDARGTFIITHQTFSAHLVGEGQLHLGCKPPGLCHLCICSFTFWHNNSQISR